MVAIETNNFCPVCGFELEEPAWKDGSPSYNICPSCGVEFGYGDFGVTISERKKRHEQLRKEWIKNGMKYKHFDDEFDPQPSNWNPIQQLKNIGIEIVDEQKYGSIKLVPPNST